MDDRAIAYLVAGIGTTIYFALAFGWWPDVDGEQFGTFVYNYYFLSLVEGRFDLPVRIVTLEGHYDPSGRAFVYHGLAPLITRAVAWPFVDLTAVSLAPLTVWLAAVGGTAVYHLVFVQILARYGPHDAMQRPLGLLLGLMIWFASPGLLLVSNDSIYHEAIGMAYLFVACFVGLLAQVVLFQKNIGSVLLSLGVFAGLCVHARPHLAVGLYAVVCLLSLVHLRQKGWDGLPCAAGAVAILFVFGAVLLVFNELRFGNVLQMSSGGTVRHGFVFWGLDSTKSPRVQAFAEHGRFNAHRIIPNLMLYLFDLPAGPLSDAIGRTFRDLTSELGLIRVTTPRIGLAYLWLPWFVVALVSIRARSADLRYAWAPLLATAVGGVLLASYGTVTLRYRVDLWPFLAVLGVLGLPRILLVLKSERNSRMTVAVLGLALAPSLFTMVVASHHNAYKFIEHELYSRWSSETCVEMVTAKEGLGPEAVERLCDL